MIFPASQSGYDSMEIGYFGESCISTLFILTEHTVWKAVQSLVLINLILHFFFSKPQLGRTIRKEQLHYFKIVVVKDTAATSHSNSSTIKGGRNQFSCYQFLQGYQFLQDRHWNSFTVALWHFESEGWLLEMKDNWYTAQFSAASVLLISKGEVLLPSKN